MLTLEFLSANRCIKCIGSSCHSQDNTAAGGDRSWNLICLARGLNAFPQTVMDCFESWGFLSVPKWWATIFLPTSSLLLTSVSLCVAHYLIGDSKLPVGVNLILSDCLSLYVSPVIDWRVYPALAQCQLGLAPPPPTPLRPGLDKRYR